MIPCQFICYNYKPICITLFPIYTRKGTSLSLYSNAWLANILLSMVTDFYFYSSLSLLRYLSIVFVFIYLNSKRFLAIVPEKTHSLLRFYLKNNTVDLLYSDHTAIFGPKMDLCIKNYDRSINYIAIIVYWLYLKDRRTNRTK